MKRGSTTSGELPNSARFGDSRPRAFVACQPYQSGSPMSQVGVVTEGGSFSVDDVENSTQANADVSMNDRSMDDTIA